MPYSAATCFWVWGIRPLRGEDIARTILWAVTQPPHVNIDEIVVTPVSQANSYYNKKEM